MNVDPSHEALEKFFSRNNTLDTVLDIGAWFIPYPRATHVVDLMPWETRGGKVQLEALPEERFNKERWHAVDITDPSMSLPFPEKYFDFCICSMTLEDLINPRFCVAEINRVAKAGYIRVPSFHEEITIGVEDRENSQIGYIHHYWICNKLGSSSLEMLEKPDLSRNYLPLTAFERLRHPLSLPRSIDLFWSDRLDVIYVDKQTTSERVKSALSGLPLRPTEYLQDKAYRALRRGRTLMRGGLRPFASKKTDWWKQMLDISKPYADPDMLKRAGGA